MVYATPKKPIPDGVKDAMSQIVGWPRAKLDDDAFLDAPDSFTFARTGKMVTPREILEETTRLSEIQKVTGFKAPREVKNFNRQMRNERKRFERNEKKA